MRIAAMLVTAGERGAHARLCENLVPAIAHHRSGVVGRGTAGTGERGDDPRLHARRDRQRSAIEILARLDFCRALIREAERTDRLRAGMLDAPQTPRLLTGREEKRKGAPN